MKRNYLSYLLRVWQTSSSEPPAWVASLEDPHTHKVIHLNSVEALLPFLLQMIERKRDGQTASDNSDLPEPPHT